MTTIKTTPLHQFHLTLGAKMVPFAGYDMPVQYPAGVLKEHLHTRAGAGLFDVSHMGQVIVKAVSGSYADAAAFSSLKLAEGYLELAATEPGANDAIRNLASGVLVTLRDGMKGKTATKLFAASRKTAAAAADVDRVLGAHRAIDPRAVRGRREPSPVAPTRSQAEADIDRVLGTSGPAEPQPGYRKVFSQLPTKGVRR